MAIPVGLYYPALGFPAFSDDFSLLVASRNGQYHGWFSSRYLGGLSIFFENNLFGNSFFVSHIFSLFYHGLTGFICLLTSRLIFREFFHLSPDVTSRSACLIAGLFILYPFHLEAVFWISGRQIILAAFFALLATYFFLRADSFFRLNGLLAVFFYVISLFCYESILLLPVIWACLHFIRVGKIPARVLVVFIFLLLLYPALGFLVGNYHSNVKYLRVDIDVLRVIKNAVSIVVRLFTPPFEQAWIFVLSGAILLLAQLLLFSRYLKTRRGVLRGVAVIVALLASVAPFFTVGIDTHDFESGRYIYFGSIVYLVILVGAIANSLSKRTFLLLIATIAACFFFYGRAVLSTWERVADVITPALRTLPTQTDNLVIGNVPDSYKGAYIFRNGLWSAFDLYENKTLGYERRLAFTKVDWDEFVRFENRFKTFTEQERSTYVDELRRLYRTKYPETPDSAITVYLFTSDGMLKLDNADGRFGD